ncbi:MAG: UvrB/UvrC motif-containing protein [Candidatus Latescibacterota bacterium]|nr:UvrB/UvrC motif-containing protein [Candidatus Latescibacterota bacterium]
MRTELAQAVEDEEYERAAQLRDQIAQLQVEDAPDA